jgi:hypothetical protein
MESVARIILPRTIEYNNMGQEGSQIGYLANYITCMANRPSFGGGMSSPQTMNRSAHLKNCICKEGMLMYGRNRVGMLYDTELASILRPK